MFKMTRLLTAATVLVCACSDGPSALPTSAAPAKSSRSVGGTSAEQGIDAIVDALNAGWAAKSATAYAAPFAEDAQVITPIGTTLSGRDAIQARHAFLFGGPLATSTQVLTVTRVQFLTGTIAIVDASAVSTVGATTTRSLFRWVMTKDRGLWEIEAQQTTNLP